MTDTPGFDATDAGHSEIARNVAAEVDLAIVLIAANDPGAMSLSRFLHEVLDDLRDRCVFVLTKFRQVPGSERADLQEHLVSWLDGAGFATAAVLRADATDIAVAARDGRAAVAPGDISAAAALAESRQIAETLRTLAADRRTHLIEATLAVLVGRLLTAVTRAAEDRRAPLEQLRGRLGAVRIVDLDEFLRTWRKGVKEDLARGARRALARARSAAGPDADLSASLDRAVEKLGSHRDIAAIVTELCDETEAILGRWMKRSLHRAVDSVSDDLAGHARDLRTTFTAQYADLAELAGSDPRPPELPRSRPAIVIPDVDLSAAFAPLRQAGKDLRSAAYLKSGGGAAAGAAIGSMIAPGIGTLVGAAAGWLAGSGRTKEKERFRAAAEAMHRESLEAARTAIGGCEQDLRAVLKGAVRALAEHYRTSAGPAVALLIAGYRKRVDDLDADLHRVLAIGSEARRRHGALVGTPQRSEG